MNIALMKMRPSIPRLGTRWLSISTVNRSIKMKVNQIYQRCNSSYPHDVNKDDLISSFSIHSRFHTPVVFSLLGFAVGS